ncbi:MAG: sodium/solute symporter [Oscillospiraceae bacterium]|nr:sodium/solute symporter [Oscillospiraceae bacterium]MDE6776806.1 sodium/solute symporter [Oscillospiraceae bacterium]
MKWVILVLYLCLMVGIGIYCNKKTKSVDDFVLGGRSIGPWFSAFAFGTSYFSAVVFIGYAGQFGWKYGISASWIGLGNALIGSLLAWVILGRRTRTMTKFLDCATMPEFFEKRYQSKALKIASSLIVFIFLIPYTASVYNGLSRLFESSLGIPYIYCIIIMAVFTAIYVIAGGFHATALNDFVQGIIMLIGIIAVVITIVNYQGGFGTAMQNLGQIPDDSGNTQTLNTIFGPYPADLLGVVILTSLGTWGLPQMIQKFYSISDDSAIKRGSVISTIFALIVSGGCYFLGGFGRLFCTTDETDSTKTLINIINGKLEYDAIVPAMLENALPEFLLGLIVVLVLSASMSTLSSLVLTSSSTLTLDLIKPAMKHNMTEKKQVLIIRIFIAIFLLISVIMAANKNAYITTLMSISWGALSGSFLAPFMLGLFSKKITPASVWACFGFGVIFTLVHTCLFLMGWFPELTQKVNSLPIPITLTSPLNAGAFCMVFSLILCPIVSQFSKIKNPQEIDKIFTCYQEG